MTYETAARNTLKFALYASCIVVIMYTAVGLHSIYLTIIGAEKPVLATFLSATTTCAIVLLALTLLASVIKTGKARVNRTDVGMTTGISLAIGAVASFAHFICSKLTQVLVSLAILG